MTCREDDPRAAGMHKRVRSLLLAGLCLANGARATDTAFWKPYQPDENTYALLAFDGPEPLTGSGRLEGTGRLTEGAAIVPDGKFGAALRVDGAGYAVFPTAPFDPAAMMLHGANRTFSIEAWIRVDGYPAADGRATIVSRPDNGGKSLGFSLFVSAGGALGMTVTPAGGRGSERVSDPGKIPLGEWTHVAGVCSGGHLSVGRDTLYVNGVEVLNQPAAEAAGTQPDETPPDLHVGGAPEGGGFAGRIDEVRIHSRVGRLWPLDPMPWIGRIAEAGMPPLDDVLDPERQPWLFFHVDGDTRPAASPALMASDPAIVERFAVSFDGAFVPGVKGQAINGKLEIGGFRLADWREGSLEFWFRPRGVNNVSDRNVGLFHASGLSAYFFNCVGHRKSLAFYYYDAERQLRMHGSDAEVHPGRWFHMVFTWDPESIVMYVDGRRASEGVNAVTTETNQGVLNEIVFRPAFDIDEVCFYERRLTAAEVANRYSSYVDPDRLVPVEPPAPIVLDAWRLPSANAIDYRLSAMAGYEDLDAASVRLADDDGREILTFEAALDGEIHRIDVPPLADGVYILQASVTVGERALESAPVVFIAAGFPWEGNRLGMTDEVFPPFEPVRVEDDRVSVVLRTCRMNGFGLWDSVVSQGRELLNGPIRLRYRTAGGAEGAWTFGDRSFVSAQPHRAEFHARASSPAVAIETLSGIEMDGMMKVTLQMGPGTERTGIERLWLEIPLNASEATLMHEDTGSMRNNYSGAIPDGTGSVWQAHGRWDRGWRNAFAGYVWAGGEERGVAWFAENDRGWITEKGRSEKPLQEIVRDGDSVLIRVHLVNVPSVIEDEREIVFGLQASPAKPMPDDWRTGARGGGLPVTPWGGHQCADKFPFQDRWEIVDRIIEQQLTGQDNREWFRAYREAHDIPPVRGTGDWLKDVAHFATWNHRPVLVYFEEMAAPTYRNDWQVYKDEWSMGLPRPRREVPEGYDGPRETWPDGYDIFRQGRPAHAAARVNFIASYRDYGAGYANEWLKRGVGIYWDNTYLTVAANPRNTAAYETEDGHVQPGLTLWNQREYSKRVWNLMHRWQRERGEKLLFLQHMTNASLLPILAWCTTSFDNEFSAVSYARNVSHPRQHDPREPFPPDYLRAQSMGRQVGNYPALCHGLFRMDDLAIEPAAIPEDEMDTPSSPERSIFAQKREWGMCRVHEIPGHAGYRPAMQNLERALLGFGYAQPGVDVHNYWAERPAVRTDRDDVKWLLLARPADKRLLLVVQSWSRQPGPVDLRVDDEALGFRPEGGIVNLETGRRIGETQTDAVTLDLSTPYALKVLGAGVPALPDGVVFRDEFDDGPSLRWTSANSIRVRDGALRMGRNEASWQGPVRIEMWQGLDHSRRDATLEVAFRLPQAPDSPAPLFTIVTRAAAPAWSRYGLSHTSLCSGQFMELRAAPADSQWELVRWNQDANGRRQGGTLQAAFGATDDPAHTLAVVMEGSASRVLFDGAEVATFPDTPELGAAFGLHGSRALSDTFCVEFDRLTLR